MKSYLEKKQEKTERIAFIVYVCVILTIGLCGGFWGDQILDVLKFIFGAIIELFTSIWGLIVSIPVAIWLVLLIIK